MGVRMSAKWDQSLAKAARLLGFISGWAATAIRSPTLLAWTAEGRKRGARQGILDRAVWWRAVVYTVVGHAGGL